MSISAGFKIYRLVLGEQAANARITARKRNFVAADEDMACTAMRRDPKLRDHFVAKSES